MLLHAVDVGSGPRTVVLLHGMMGSAQSWHRVTDALVGRGFRVVALDLPGHGLSPRDPSLSIDRAADAVVRTLAHVMLESPDVAIGHSFGATVLAAAAPRLDPELAIYVDAALALQGGHAREPLVAQYEQDRRARLSPEALRSLRPFYSEHDATVEALAAEQFDPATAASVSCGLDGRWTAAPGSIVVRAEPSAWVADEDARRFEAAGVRVRSIPGAAHTVWYSHYEAFTHALPELFDA